SSSRPGTRRWPLLTPPGMTAAARNARSDLVNAVMVNHLLVERDADAGCGRHENRPILLDRESLLRQRLVDRRLSHAVLLEECIRDDGVALQRRRLDDPALPGVRHRLDAVVAGDLGDAQPLADAAAAGDVRLHEVDMAAL